MFCLTVFYVVFPSYFLFWQGQNEIPQSLSAESCENGRLVNFKRKFI